MFRLSIVTPEKVFYDDDIVSLVVPGTEGYLGVLSNHAPLITALKPGRIEFRNTKEEVSILSPNLRLKQRILMSKTLRKGTKVLMSKKKKMPSKELRTVSRFTKRINRFLSPFDSAQGDLKNLC